MHQVERVEMPAESRQCRWLGMQELPITDCDRISNCSVLRNKPRS
jgi:hypothetical protein